MIKFKIAGGNGKFVNEVSVSDRNSLSTHNIEPPLPKLGKGNPYRFFSKLIADSSGNNSLNVDGSSTPQEFTCDAELKDDLHIMSIVFVLVGTAVTLKKFGGIAALTTGIDCNVEESGTITPILDKVKSNGEIMINSGSEFPRGDDNIVSNFVGIDDGFILNFPIRNYLPGGLRLGRKSADKLSLVVNDDLTGMADFTVRCLGYRHFEI